MFSYILNVYSDKNKVFIIGINLRTIIKDLSLIVPKSVAMHMFSRTNTSLCLIVYDFFIPDIVYLLNCLIEIKTTIVQTPVYVKIIELINTNTWYKSVYTEHLPILNYKLLNKLKIKLMDHQLDFLNMYNEKVPKYELDGYMLAAPAGTGKTIMNLALSICLDADIVIIVAPNNSIYKVWEQTILTYIEGSEVWVSKNDKPFTNNCKYFVFHYEALELALELKSKFRCTNPCIILDECHNFNEITAKRTNIFIEVCEQYEHRNVIWASGTPLKALGSEIIPFLRTIDRKFVGVAIRDFKNIFGLNSTRAISILSNRIGQSSFKIDKALVVDGVPIVEELLVKTKDSNLYTLETIKKDMYEFIASRTTYYKTEFPRIESIYLEGLEIFKKSSSYLSNKKDFEIYQGYVERIRKHYDPFSMRDISIFCNNFELKIIAPLLNQPFKKEWIDSRSVVKYVKLKIRGECLGRVLSNKRIECIKSLVDYTPLDDLIHDSAKKVVIFTSYVDVVDRTVERLKHLKFNPLMVYGDTNSMVTELVTKFENDPKFNPMVATFKSLSTAVPLTVANTIVMMNLPFRDYEYQQAVSRCHRLGQDTQVYVYKIILDTGEEPNISTRSKDIMEWSLQQVNLLMGLEGDDTPDIDMECISQDLITEIIDTTYSFNPFGHEFKSNLKW